MWILVAFLAPVFYALANVLDNVLVNGKFKNPITLLFYASILNLIFIPFLFALQPPELPPFGTLPTFLMLGLANVGYLFPYYRGLQTEDTSVAIALFGIGRVFVPIFAFLVIGEVLTLTQYVGILLIVISVSALGLNYQRKRFEFSSGVWYIGSAAIITALEGVLLKLLFEQGVSVSTAIGGEMIISLLLAALLLIPRTRRNDIVASAELFRSMAPVFLVEELLTFCGFAAETHAISLAPVSVVKGITMSTPFFLLMYAWVGERRFPALFKENLQKGTLIRKIFLFALLVAGVALQ